MVEPASGRRGAATGCFNTALGPYQSSARRHGVMNWRPGCHQKLLRPEAEREQLRVLPRAWASVALSHNARPCAAMDKQRYRIEDASRGPEQPAHRHRPPHSCDASAPATFEPRLVWSLWRSIWDECSFGAESHLLGGALEGLDWPVVVRGTCNRTCDRHKPHVRAWTTRRPHVVPLIRLRRGTKSVRSAR